MSPNTPSQLRQCGVDFRIHKLPRWDSGRMKPLIKYSSMRTFKCLFLILASMADMFKTDRTDAVLN